MTCMMTRTLKKGDKWTVKWAGGGGLVVGFWRNNGSLLPLLLGLGVGTWRWACWALGFVLAWA